MKSRILAGLILTVTAVGALGCRTAVKTEPGAGADKSDPGTSTGLPYRPAGKPTLVEIPPAYRVYPTPAPAPAPVAR